MADSMTGSAARCPWCSSVLPDAAPERCPSCGAVLAVVPDAPAEIKGVTTLDTEAIIRARSEVARPQRTNRLLSFITGEVSVDTGPPPSPESLAPPADEVRREMLRLQLEAERANLAAETIALKSDELARRGIHVSELGGPGDAVEDAAAPEDEASPEDEAAPGPGGSWPKELTPHGEPEEPTQG
jgi:hypothetical protein